MINSFLKVRNLSIVLFLAIVFLITFFLYTQSSTPISVKKDIGQITERIVNQCAEVTNKTKCYEDLISSLVLEPMNLTMEEAFQVVKSAQRLDSKYYYCHDLSHKLARSEMQKKDNDWRDVAARCPMNLCAKGCIHGVFQEKYKDQTLSDAEIEQNIPELDALCKPRSSWQPSGSQQASCYHGLGHLFMYITDANIEESLRLCSKLAVSEHKLNFRAPCLHGIFMQIFQSSNYEIVNLINKFNLSLETAPSFCQKFDKETAAICWMESWPFQAQEINNANGLKNFCYQLDKDHQSDCFAFMFTIITFNFRYDQDKLLDYCSSMQDGLAAECASRVALAILQNDNEHIEQASGFCKKASDYDPKHQCYNLLATMASYNFSLGSKERTDLCNSLPETVKESCFKN